MNAEREKGLRKTWELNELNITRNKVGETRIFINGVDIPGKNVSAKPSKVTSGLRPMHEHKEHSSLPPVTINRMIHLEDSAQPQLVQIKI
jgi:hypothetical protein